MTFDGLAYTPERVPPGYVLVFEGVPASVLELAEVLEEEGVRHVVRRPTSLSADGSSHARVFVPPRAEDEAKRIIEEHLSPREEPPAQTIASKDDTGDSTVLSVPPTSRRPSRGDARSREIAMMRIIYHVVRVCSLVFIGFALLLMWFSLLEGLVAGGIATVLLLIVGFYLWVHSVKLGDSLERRRRRKAV